jgi:hypothetical protein
MKRLLGVALLLLTAAAIIWVLTPAVLLRPFTAQSPGGIRASYFLRSTGGAATLAALLLGVSAAVMLWPRLSRRLGKAALALAVILLAGAALLARQNHFEWMFRPLPAPQFVEAAAAAHLDDDEDLVLGVRLGGQARAYPVRALAYHHVVNDRVGDEPVVATY